MVKKIEIDRDELQRLVDKGLTLKEMGKAFGVNLQTVGRRIKEYGIERESQSTRERKVQKEQLIQLLEQGYTQEEIAEILGCSGATVSKWKKKYGLGKPKKEKKKPRVPRLKVPIVPDKKPANLKLHLTAEQAHDLNLVIASIWQTKSVDSPQDAIRWMITDEAERIRREKKEEQLQSRKKYKHIGNGNWRQV